MINKLLYPLLIVVASLETLSAQELLSLTKSTDLEKSHYVSSPSTGDVQDLAPWNPFASRWELTLNGGWSYLLGKVNEQVPADFIDYTKGLKSGYHLDAGLGYYWSARMGIGVRYARFGSKEEIDNVMLTNDVTGETLYGSMSDNIAVHFIAPAYNMRHRIANGRLAIHTFAALGYISYVNNGMLVGQPVKMTGQTVGLSLGGGLLIPLGRHISLSAGASVLGGSIAKMRTQGFGQDRTVELDDDERENLGRVDLSAGLRFRW